MGEYSIFGLPIIVTDAASAEGEILCGSFPQPERDNMTLEEYAKQCTKYFARIKLTDGEVKN